MDCTFKSIMWRGFIYRDYSKRNGWAYALEPQNIIENPGLSAASHRHRLWGMLEKRSYLRPKGRECITTGFLERTEDFLWRNLASLRVEGRSIAEKGSWLAWRLWKKPQYKRKSHSFAKKWMLSRQLPSSLGRWIWLWIWQMTLEITGFCSQRILTNIHWSATTMCQELS